MSYDYALEKPCTHQVIFETAALDPIFQNTIRFQRPPISLNVTLYINGDMVPPMGLFSHARLPCTNPAPYTVVSGKSDMLYLQLGADTPTFIQMNPGFNLSAANIVSDLSTKIPGLNVTAVNNHVVFSTPARVNGRAFTFVDPRWTDKTSSLPTTARVLGGYNALGIVPGRVVSGYPLFPSWSLVKDPTSAYDNGRMIQLSQPLKGDEPIVLVTYFTQAQYCRRCYGVRIEFDYNVLNATYETVQNADLLSQEFDKFLFTRIGSHWKWPWLGSNLTNRIGGKGNTGSSNVSAFVSMDINTAFATYQSIKSQQDTGFPTQMVSDAEFPKALDNVSVLPVTGDPTTYIVTASLVTRSLVPVELTRVIGQPNPFAAASSNPTAALFFANNPDFLLRG